MINIDTHSFLEARHVYFMTTIKERSWFANGTNPDAIRAVSNLFWGACLRNTFQIWLTKKPPWQQALSRSANAVAAAVMSCGSSPQKRDGLSWLRHSWPSLRSLFCRVFQAATKRNTSSWSLWRLRRSSLWSYTLFSAWFTCSRSSQQCSGIQFLAWLGVFWPP